MAQAEGFSFAPLVYPSVSINGTSRDELARQFHESVNALRAAIATLEENGPNARDYGPEFSAAVEHQHRRIVTLKAFQIEMEELYRHVIDAE